MDLGSLIDRAERIASHQGCHGPFDENCNEYPEAVAEWCAPCVLGRLVMESRRLVNDEPKDSERC